MDASIVRIIEQIEWDFHRRAFGDELARVNFLAPAERRAYVARLRERARHRRFSSSAARQGIVRRIARRDGQEARAITVIMAGQKAVSRLARGIVRAHKASRKSSMPLD